jgi:hypothetical protein
MEFRKEDLIFGKFPNMKIFCTEEKEEGEIVYYSYRAYSYN